MNIEPLESRIAPATIIALTDSDQLLRFNSASPDSITASVPILGLGATEDVEGIDFRPANGLLYGVAVDGTTARLLTIDPLTGATAQIGATFAVTGSDFGVDFNPVADRLRVVSDTDLNLSINPNTGVATTQTSLNPGNPNVVGAAYTNSFPGTSSTSLFAIDSGSDTLATIAPPSAGTLTNVGALGVGDVTAATGFDIGQGTGESFAALTVGATTQLYSINLTTGAATALGNINAGTVSMRGLAVLQNTWDGSESATLDDPDNWVAGIAPVAGDSLLFPVGPTQLSVKSFYAANTAFNTVRFTGAGYSLSSEFANKITGGIRANFASGTTKVDGTNLLLSSPDGIAPGIVEVAQSGATLDFFQLKIATNLGVDFIGTGNVKIGTLGFETPIGGGDVRVQGAHVTLTGVLHSARTAHVQSGSLELLGFDFFGQAGDVVVEGGTLLGSGSADDVTVNTGVLLTGDDGLHTGDLTLAATGTARFEIPASDESFNPLQVAGTVALGGATLDLAALGANTPGRVTLINNDGTADGIVGIFGVATEGSNVLLGGATYTISYVGGDGNDVVLTRTFTSAVNIATGGKTATFTDLDGDKVTVKVTKGELLQKDFVLRDAGIGAQLELLDLTAPGFAGAAVTIISARQGGGGDGSVNVGYINAFGNDLASVTVDGDLGAIDAGDLTATTSGLKALTAQSMGVFGLSTGGPDLASFIRGKLDKATIRGSIVGAVLSSPSIGAITVSGSVVGTTADNSGQISGFSSLGSVTVGGSLIGGGGLFSGAILGPFKSVTIAGDVLGGSGDSSGSLQAFADVGTLKIGGDLRAGSGFGSGSFYLFNNFAASVSIGGSLFGSASGASGSIDVKSAGTISIAGDMNDSARVQVATTAKSLTIGGSVFGSYIGSQLNPVGDIGTLKIGGSITQGAAQFGNNGISAKSITTLSVDGSIVGEEAGVEVNDALGAASITGSIVGATVRADSIASLTLGGSLVGLNFGSSGEIEARTGSIGSLKITGDLRESSTGAGGRVLVPAGNLGSFSLGGSVFGGAISVAGDIGAMTVGGSLRNADITAGALSSPTAGADLVLKSLAVKGSVENSRIFAGYSAGFSALNADAQIGAVTVGGDWIASDLVAGVQANGGGFGNADDGKIVGGINDANLHSKIASLVIKGQALGTAAAGDHFGIVAQEIGSVKVGAITYPLTKLPFNDDLDANDPLLLIGATNDFRVHEVAL